MKVLENKKEENVANVEGVRIEIESGMATDIGGHAH